MEIIFNQPNINNYNIFFKKPIKNQNEKFSSFYKLLYSNNIYSLKYLLINLDIVNYTIIQEGYKHKLVGNMSETFMKCIEKIEYTILNALKNNLKTKKKVSINLLNDLKSRGYIYIFNEPPDFDKIYLKISGVWEDHTKIGLVYKICYNTSI